MSPGTPLRIGFLGAGQMATALAKGWIAAGLADAQHTVGSDPIPLARESFQAVTGVKAVADNREVVTGSDVLVFAVKPQSMAKLLDDIAPVVGARHLIISIAAGITLKQLAASLGHDRRLIRVMPNTPCLLGAS